MSVAVMSAVWKQGPEDRSQRLLMLALADSANDQGICWPGTQTLAGKTCMNVRTVLRALKSLEDGEWLKITRRSVAHKGNTYQLNLEKLCDTVSRDKLSRDKTDQSHMTKRTKSHDISNNPPHPPIGRTVKNHQESLGDAREDEGENDPCISAILLSEESGKYDVRFQRDRAMQIETVARKRGITCRAAAEFMVAQWKIYNSSRSKLSYPVQSAERFWTSGTWHDIQAWPWKDGHPTRRLRAVGE